MYAEFTRKDDSVEEWQNRVKKEKIQSGTYIYTIYVGVLLNNGRNTFVFHRIVGGEGGGQCLLCVPWYARACEAYPRRTKIVDMMIDKVYPVKGMKRDGNADAQPIRRFYFRSPFN